MNDELDRSLRAMLGFTTAEDQEAAARGECVWFIGGAGQRVCGARRCRAHGSPAVVSENQTPSTPASPGGE